MTDVESRAPHGTRARYQAGCREGCPASPTCTERNNAYVAERRAAQATETPTRARAERKPTRQIGLSVDEPLHALLERWATEASERERRKVTVTEEARRMLVRGIKDKARREQRRRQKGTTR